VIGVTRPVTFAEGPGVLYCGEKKDRQGRSLQFTAPVRLPGPTEKSDDCAIIDLPSNSGLSVFNPICEAATNALVNKEARRERFAVEKVQRLRAMGSLCRQQAAYNSMNKWKLLAEAEYWDHLADLELSSHFQQCNAAGSNEIEQPQPITNTDDAERKTISA
jgi:hypothetical protein